jgi:hypothetical protein
VYDRERVDPDVSTDAAFVNEVERLALTERARLSSLGIEARFVGWSDHPVKTAAEVVLDCLPYASADLLVYASGEAELAAAWGQHRPGDWDQTLFEHLDLDSVDSVRLALDRLVSLVLMDRKPQPGPQ